MAETRIIQSANDIWGSDVEAIDVIYPKARVVTTFVLAALPGIRWRINRDYKNIRNGARRERPDIYALISGRFWIGIEIESESRTKYAFESRIGRHATSPCLPICVIRFNTGTYTELADIGKTKNKSSAWVEERNTYARDCQREMQSRLGQLCRMITEIINQSVSQTYEAGICQSVNWSQASDIASFAFDGINYINTVTSSAEPVNIQPVTPRRPRSTRRSVASKSSRKSQVASAVLVDEPGVRFASTTKSAESGVFMLKNISDLEPEVIKTVKVIKVTSRDELNAFVASRVCVSLPLFTELRFCTLYQTEPLFKPKLPVMFNIEKLSINGTGADYMPIYGIEDNIPETLGKRVESVRRISISGDSRINISQTSTIFPNLLTFESRGAALKSRSDCVLNAKTIIVAAGSIPPTFKVTADSVYISDIDAGTVKICGPIRELKLHGCSNMTLLFTEPVDRLEINKCSNISISASYIDTLICRPASGITCNNRFDVKKIEADDYEQISEQCNYLCV